MRSSAYEKSSEIIAIIEGLEFSEGREDSCFIASTFEEFVSKVVKSFFS